MFLIFFPRIEHSFFFTTTFKILRVREEKFSVLYHYMVSNDVLWHPGDDGRVKGSDSFSLKTAEDDVQRKNLTLTKLHVCASEPRSWFVFYNAFYIDRQTDRLRDRSNAMKAIHMVESVCMYALIYLSVYLPLSSYLYIYR